MQPSPSREKLRIALVTYALEIGGVETMLGYLADAFTERGHDVLFLETEKKGRWSETFSHQGRQVETISGAWRRSPEARARAIADCLKGMDAVLINDAPLAQSALGLLDEKCRVFPVLHNALPSMMTNATGNAGEWDAIVCVNASFPAQLVKQYGLEKSTVRYIPNGVAPGIDRHFVAGPGRAVQVGFIGRVEQRQKGVLHLPGILLGCDAREQVRLHVAGNGPDAKKLKERCADAGIQTVFHGALAHDQALKLMESLDILLLPSYYEGLPIVLLEAMTRGVVPIVSRLDGGIEQVVHHEENGLLATPGDEAAFATALQRVIIDAAERIRLARAAQKTARKTFSSKRMATDYESLIHSCRDGGPGRQPPRSGRLDLSLLGDFPGLPGLLHRPLRRWRRWQQGRGA